MRFERYQNDRHFIWYFYIKNEEKTPYDLEGKDLSLEVRVGLSAFQVEEFTVSGNSIDFYFRGRTQNRPGLINLILYINKGKDGQQAFDAIAGGLVPHSDMSGCVGPSGCHVNGSEVTSFVGEWIDDRLIPASIARMDAVNEGLSAIRAELESFKSSVNTMLDRLHEAAHWSDAFVWKDTLIWRE